MSAVLDTLAHQLAAELAPRLAAELAPRIAAELTPLIEREAAGTVATSEPVDAATLAGILGVSRAYVYEHADRLGAIRLGTGKRARLRFDVASARAALVPDDARLSSGTESQPRRPRRRVRTTTTGGVLQVRASTNRPSDRSAKKGSTQ